MNSVGVTEEANMKLLNYCNKNNVKTRDIIMNHVRGVLSGEIKMAKPFNPSDKNRKKIMPLTFHLNFSNKKEFATYTSLLKEDDVPIWKDIEKMIYELEGA